MEYQPSDTAIVVKTAGGDLTKIAAATAPGAVHLSVSNLERSGRFYEQLLGLRRKPQPDESVEFAATDTGFPLLVLHGGATAPLDHSRPGLYHFALLVESRRALAAALVRLASARWPLSGASDHLVSEALYLEDPDSIGIEIYRDRPRAEWPLRGDGQVEMATLPLDLDALIDELEHDPVDQQLDRLAPASTTMGHVHLQVHDLRTAEAFYAGVLGLDVTQRGYPGALFLSAGGYHHHIGLNVWHSRGGQRATAGAVGLRGFEIRLPDGGALESVLDRVQAAGAPAREELRSDAKVFAVEDPSGNRVLLRV